MNKDLDASALISTIACCKLNTSGIVWSSENKKVTNTNENHFFSSAFHLWFFSERKYDFPETAKIENLPESTDDHSSLKFSADSIATGNNLLVKQSSLANKFAKVSQRCC